jgi:hypothetical protein
MNTFLTSCSPRLASASALRLLSADPLPALEAAALLERLADLHQNEGRRYTDLLSHLTYELRCRALRVRP